MATVESKEDMRLIVASQFTNWQNISKDGEQAYDRSVILELVDHLMKTIKADGYQDIKTLNLILPFITNCVCSGREFADKVARETCVLEVIRDIVTQKQAFDQPILLKTVVSVIGSLIDTDLNEQDLLAFIQPTITCFLATGEEDVMSIVECVLILKEYASKHDDLIPKFATGQVITKLCTLLASKDANIYTPVALTLACTFVYDESPTIIDRAILDGVLQKFLNILYSGGGSELYHQILWGLSNITGSYCSHVDAFLQEEELVQRVITLTQNPSHLIKSEAMYVITNAIQCADVNTRMQFLDVFKQDLINSLCNSLDRTTAR